MSESNRVQSFVLFNAIGARDTVKHMLSTKIS